MIETELIEIPISRQCELLGILRSGYYYQPQEETDLNLHIMNLIDEQYTKMPFYGINKMTAWLRKCGIRISMDGRGRVFDNIFIERLWRSVKYEEVYVKNYESVRDAYTNLARYFQLYNRERLHESLGYSTPHEVYFGYNKKNDGEAFRLIHQIQPLFVS